MDQAPSVREWSSRGAKRLPSRLQRRCWLWAAQTAHCCATKFSLTPMRGPEYWDFCQPPKVMQCSSSTSCVGRHVGDSAGMGWCKVGLIWSSWLAAPCVTFSLISLQWRACACSPIPTSPFEETRQCPHRSHEAERTLAQCFLGLPLAKILAPRLVSSNAAQSHAALPLAVTQEIHHGLWRLSNLTVRYPKNEEL